MNEKFKDTLNKLTVAAPVAAVVGAASSALPVFA